MDMRQMREWMAYYQIEVDQKRQARHEAKAKANRGLVTRG